MKHIEEIDIPSLEISPGSAAEISKLGIGCLIDIRQNFELEIKGSIPEAMHIPFFKVKKFLGYTLTEDEQEILDADEPDDLDIKMFITKMNQLRQGNDCVFLVVCNSGRRSLFATKLLREMGYKKTYSVRGGIISLGPILIPTSPQ